MAHQDILLIIRKKTTVPTKRQLPGYETISQWREVSRINYDYSEYFFSKVLSDGQFALWLKNNLGIGEYMITAWKKGRKGFWLFAKFLCMDDRFCRIPKKQTLEFKEMRKLKREYNQLIEQLKKTPNQEERQQIATRVNEIISQYKFNDDFNKVNLNKERSTAPYIKTIQPIYRHHEYEAIGTPQEENPNKQEEEEKSPEFNPKEDGFEAEWV